MTRPKLIILGSGFAAFSCLKSIDEDRYEVILVSPRNHFLFSPLLPSTTVGTIEFRSIIESIRVAKSGIQYYQAKCIGIDPNRKCIVCEQALHDGKEIDRTSFSLDFDYLVIAVGSSNNTFGIPGVTENALFLKEVWDARAIRQKIIDCLERASVPNLVESERQRLLHFVVVGGGPTGVEFAAEMHDFLVEDLRNHFPKLISDVRILLLEATDQILSSFDASLGAYTMKHFKRQRIEVRTGSGVVKVDPELVHLQDGSSIPFGVLVWSTGIGPNGLVRSLPFPKQKNGRLTVDQYFRIPGSENIYAAGDCATPDQQNLPATAQIAQQEGRYLARSFNRMARGKEVSPFTYKNFGMLAYIGGNQALADLKTFKGRGYTTWLFWRSAYWTKLVSAKNKILVVVDWLKTQFFGRDLSRF